MPRIMTQQIYLGGGGGGDPRCTLTAVYYYYHSNVGHDKIRGRG